MQQACRLGPKDVASRLISRPLRSRDNIQNAEKHVITSISICKTSRNSFSSSSSVLNRYKKPEESTPYPKLRANLNHKPQDLSESASITKPFNFWPSSYQTTVSPSPVEGARSHSRARPPPEWHTTYTITNAPTSVLEQELIYLASTQKPNKKIHNLLHELIHIRKIKPIGVHYEALILGNGNLHFGSVENVKAILREMIEQNITVDVHIYTAVLRVLAVHPDVEMMEDVFEQCAKRWIAIDTEMMHLASAICLAADMPELAMEWFEKIEETRDPRTLSSEREKAHDAQYASGAKGKVELWLYMLSIRYFMGKRDWDTVMRLCYRLDADESQGTFQMRQIDIPFDFWAACLTCAVDDNEYWVARWIWDVWVLKKWIEPSTRTAMKILYIAAEEGDIRLAESISIVLNCLAEPHWKSDESRSKEIEESTAWTWREIERESQELVQRAYEVAYEEKTCDSVAGRQEIERMSDKERILTAPIWFAFRNRRMSNGQGMLLREGESLRLDPWEALAEEYDSGYAWPRVVAAERERSRRSDLVRAANEAYLEANPLGRDILESGHFDKLDGHTEPSSNEAEEDFKSSSTQTTLGERIAKAHR